MGRRDYPERPLVGAGAVIVRGDQVVLVRRGRPPLAGEWSIPGGVVKLGETLRQAAEREAREETGLIKDVAFIISDTIFRQKIQKLPFEITPGVMALLIADVFHSGVHA